MFTYVLELSGAASHGFLTTFKTLVNCYKPNFLALFKLRISGERDDNFIRKCGFTISHRVEAVGFAGGIWLLWNEDIQVAVMVNNRQFIHCRISKLGRYFWVTAVYASPVRTVRKQLWPTLNILAQMVNGPWIIGGDFNTIMNAAEKRGVCWECNWCV